MYGLIFLSLEDQRMRYWIRKYNSILKSKDDFKITTATKPSIIHAPEIILVTPFWSSNFNCLTLGLNPISVAMLKRSLSRVIKAKIHLVLMNYWQFIFTQLRFPARLMQAAKVSALLPISGRHVKCFLMMFPRSVKFIINFETTMDDYRQFLLRWHTRVKTKSYLKMIR